MIEIGSEYWLSQSEINTNSHSFESLIGIGQDRKLLFSGRTAIDYVLDDIEKNIKSVYMPSYCCSSMIQPFKDRNITIEFYEVYLSKDGLKYKVDHSKQVDIFFASSYFGCKQTNMDSIISIFSQKKTIVIEDITHRLLSDEYFCKQADYHIASLRKWFSVPTGGLAVKQSGLFNNITLSVPPSEVIEKKINAMEKKALYITNENNSSKKEKGEFLKLYGEFNTNLAANYKGYLIDEKSEKILKSIDINLIKKERRKNVKHLYKNFKAIEGIELLFNKPDLEKDCFLFVPLIVKEKNVRNNLRNYLITNSIFCPIHWPVPNEISGTDFESIYQLEISLICDQRYGLPDIERMLEKVGEFNNSL